MKGKVNGNGNLLAFGSNPLTETKVEVTAFNMVERLFQLFVKCLLGCFVHCPYIFFFGGGGVRGVRAGRKCKDSQINYFCYTPLPMFRRNGEGNTTK